MTVGFKNGHIRMWLENKTFELNQQDIVKVIWFALSVLMKLLLAKVALLNVHFLFRKLVMRDMLKHTALK